MWIWYSSCIIMIVLYFHKAPSPHYDNGLNLLKGEVKPKIKFSPVVFGVLSQMVLVRGSWDALFLLYSQSNSRTSTDTGWLRPTRWGFVCKMSLKAPFRSYQSTANRDWPICCSQQATTFTPRFNSKVQRFNSSGRNSLKHAVSCSLLPAGTVTRWVVYAQARDRLFSHVRLGIRAKRYIAAFGTKTSRLSVQTTTTYGPIMVIRAFIRTRWHF